MTDSERLSKDQPLNDDMKWLTAALGRAMLRLEGQPAFEAVEQLRRACRDRRRGYSGAKSLRELLIEVDRLPLELAAPTARAFTLYFLLINTAEQVHRVRRRRAYDTGAEAIAQPASLRWAFEQLKSQGKAATDVRKSLANLKARPVLTAHPTEATRRTLLNLQARLADALLARDSATTSERLRLEEQMEADIELLWLTDEVRKNRPSVMDEVSTVIWYLEDRLLDATAQVHEACATAFRETFQEELGTEVPLTLGSWVAGDRDGNPFVTPELTVAAARRHSHAIMGHYEKRIARLIERLSISSRIAPPSPALRASIDADKALLPEVWQANNKRDAEEPLRLKLSFVVGRIQATRQQIAARDAGKSDTYGAAYKNAAELVRDVELIEEAVSGAKASLAVRSLVTPLLAEIRQVGVHGYNMDVREDSEAHTRAVDAICASVGLGPLRGASLVGELVGRRPLTSPNLKLDADTEKVLQVFDAVRDIQDEIDPHHFDDAQR
jgi:phosphoenolpyruvate carboxylase